MSFNDISATTTINIGALIDTTATSTQNVRSLLAGSVAWSYATVEWFADSTWTPAQISTLNTIFNTWGTVTGITFQQTTVQNDAEVILISDNNTNGFGGYSGIPADVPTTANQTFTDGSVVVSQTGQINIHIAPGGFIGDGTTNINIFDAAGNITGGGFELILHEIGHSLGLKHPHNGSTGNSLLWPGVTSVNDLGTNSLNQDLYTLMSYNFQVVPDGAGGKTLYTMATPMAYDIAAIQLLYGANTTFNSGDTTYDLATPAAALQWTSIWDTGGTDEIIYSGTNAATIDLRSATLDGTVGSGGYLSYLTFADGRTSAGFTIAGDIRNVLGDVGTEHGVIIENALGGKGNDEITGNAANNFLEGREGSDILTGLAGADTFAYRIGDGTDRIKDFKASEGDKIDLKGTTFSNFLGLQTLITQDGSNNTKITLGDGGLVLENVTPTSLTKDQFLLPADTAPVIASGAAGDAATYFVRVNDKAITTLAATDVNLGDVISFSIIGGADANRFGIDNNGVLFFKSQPNPPSHSYEVMIQASDGQGGLDTQDITINVTADKMKGDAAHSVSETFVFHPKFGANTISNFDIAGDSTSPLAHDFLQFDKGMFSADTAAAVLAASHETKNGDVVIDVHAGHLTIVGVKAADLQAHQDDILFV